MPTQKVCTICSTEPALGIGVGKMKSTCPGCIASMIAEGTCPACRGVETYSTEHIGVCTGKLPAKPKGSHKAPKGGTGGGSATKTAHQIGVEGEANKRSEGRRVARVLSRSEASNLVAKCQQELKDAKESADPKAIAKADKALKAAKEKQVAANAVPEGKCGVCGCFLSDRGKCVNEECAEAA